MKTFKIGDSVETIDDAIKGIVISVKQNKIKIKDEFDFEIEFSANELMLSKSDIDVENAIFNTDIDTVKREKEAIHTPQKQKRLKPKERHTPKFEVDLHIHHLTDTTKNMTNFDMLNLQLNTAKRQLDFAIKKRIPKMVIIHGVGEGVLRKELETLLNRYDNVTYYDADYKTYGLGATEVKIFQNV